jgi:glycosyltransferase involved in cell wall biosynthesis
MARKCKIVSSSKREILFLFNLSVRKQNEILSHSIDWINEFSNHFIKVFVFTMEGDGTDNSAILGLVKRLKTKDDDKGIMIVLRCLRSLPDIYRYRKKACVFFHMNHKPALVVGFFLRVWGIPSGLWFSHKQASSSLKIAHTLVDFVVSSTTEAFPIRSNKLLVTGHGLSKVFLNPINENTRKLGIVHVGRVVPVKKIEKIIFALGGLDCEYRSIDLIGITPNLRYKEFIEEIAARLNVRITFLGPMSKEKLSKQLGYYSACYSGTEKSVDKAPLEAASLGCFVVSNNDSVMRLSGMDLLLSRTNNGQIPKSLQGLLSELIVQKTYDSLESRLFISARSRESNSLASTIKLISQELIEGK